MDNRALACHMFSMKWALPCGREVEVDDEDFERVRPFRWRSLVTRSGLVYAQRHAPKGEPALLHRFILNPASDVLIDHEDGNGLNCTRSNMREASAVQNAQNARLKSNNTSGFKGVSWETRRSKWVAFVRAAGRKVNLGYFSTAEEADRAARRFRIEQHGKFACHGRIST